MRMASGPGFGPEFGQQVVTGAPFSAQAITEIRQTLADGNRITRKVVVDVARDSAGRTRREQALAGPASLVSEAEPPRVIVIRDPVAKVTWSLDPAHQTARKLSLDAPPIGGLPKVRMTPPTEGEPPADAPPPPPPPPPPHPPALDAPAGFALGPPSGKAVTESLGKKSIDGIEAEGTRITATIPAGAIGNERPIEVVTERWYRPGFT